MQAVYPPARGLLRRLTARVTRCRCALIILALVLSGYSLPAFSAAIDEGAALSAGWSIPFAGLLLSTALLPLCAPAFWHRHFGKVAAFWSLAFALPCAAVYGVRAASANVTHALVAEYIPFIILLAALYTIAGGLCVRGNLHGSPRVNTALLAFGTALASVMGTTGAAMLFIRPLLRANDNRKHVTHVFIFFIFLVANIGGALTPLGDPPLFLGFLNGVGFFWTTAHLLKPMLFTSTVLLALFYAIDSYYFHQREEARSPFLDPTPDSPIFFIEGKINFALLACALVLVLASGLWKAGTAFEICGVAIAWQSLLRDVLLLVVIFISLRYTPKSARAGNAFSWGPMLEVAKLFAGVFITITPVIAILRAGDTGAFDFVVRAVSDSGGRANDAMYFWTTGLLSSFLDNAPTYLVFFNMAGGDAARLMRDGATTLAAISAGAVFMGANTYIGNAPNLMVKAMAQSCGVRMPGFFGFMAWSGVILMPTFALTTLIFFVN